MLKWNSAKLKDLPIQFIDGDRSYRYPKQEEFQEDGIAFLNSTAIVDNKIDFQKINFISVEKFNQLTKGKLQHNDIVMTTRGNGVGKLAYFNDPRFPTGFINAQMLIIRSDKKSFEQKFLFYLFSSNDMQDKFWGFASGSAQPQLPIRDLREIEINYPELPVQRKIADVLSAYDDLIEVNTRRIRILEQMAQSVYREWFGKVDEKSLPEGWEIGFINDILEISRSSINPARFPNEEFDHFSIPAFDDKKLPVIEKGKEILSNKFLVTSDVVLLAKMNPRIPRSWLPHVDNIRRAITSSEFLVLKARKPFSKYFVFTLFQMPEFQDEFANLALGTSTSHQRVKPDDLLKIRTPIPPTEMIVGFTKKIQPIYELAFNLLVKNANLRRTRDLLLPRLVSGEIELQLEQ